MNLKNMNKKLTQPGGLYKKERIFSAVTAGAKNRADKPSLATFDTQDMPDDGNTALNIVEPWIGVTDSNLAMKAVIPRSKRIRFSGLKTSGGLRLNRAST